MKTRTLVITSTRSWAGKTTLALGLVRNLGGGCAYYKPWWDQMGPGKGRTTDLDAHLMESVLGAGDAGADRARGPHLDLPPECDSACRASSPGDHSDALREGATRAAADADGPLLVEGPANFSLGISLGLDAARVAADLDAAVLLVADGGLGVVLDKLLLCATHFASVGVDVAGIVVNKVPPSGAKEWRERIVSALGPGGPPLLGLIPREPELSRIPMRQVLEELNGKLLAGDRGLDDTISKILVGAMTVERTVRMPLFHTPDKLLITGGDRIDMQLAVLETEVAGMVLTGGVYPDPKVIAMADDRNVPLIMVRPDTLTAVENLERVKARTRPSDTGRIEFVRELVGSHLDLEPLR